MKNRKKSHTAKRPIKTLDAADLKRIRGGASSRRAISSIVVTGTRSSLDPDRGIAVFPSRN